MSHHYNPDWLSDDTLLANFVARQSDFAFLRDELANVPLEGTVQHYLLVGVRGAGKTTLLKRLAVAIRRDSDLRDHLIALSFPEELYQVKHLADFWWAACDALADELDRLERHAEVDALEQAMNQTRRTDDKNPTSDTGFQLLLQTCTQLQRRPVLLVDNLDMVFERIDKSGRKLNDPKAPAYWALREALSTSTSPVVIGGSVRLTDAFKDYDQAFYDFFLPKRLGKLSLAEVRAVLERLADAQGLPDVKARLQARPGRIEMLFELTGGNPRALSLIFDVVRNGANSRAVEDFERLMDITTPYYKARIEDLSEQAQVIMHAIAVHPDEGVRFGFTAAEIGKQAGLPTTTVSAQLTILENEGLVEKSTDHGRAQYRIAEQLFRLWLQMRANRRIRQNVIGLTKFFEALYDPDELQNGVREPCGASALAEAKFAFAVAGACDANEEQRNELEAYGTEKLRQHVEQNGGKMDDYLPAQDIVDSSVPANTKDQSARDWLLQGNKAKSEGDLAAAEAVYRKAIELDPAYAAPWNNLGNLLTQMARYEEAEEAYRKAILLKPTYARPWNGLGNLLSDHLDRYEEAEAAYRQAIALDSKSFQYLFNLGLLLTYDLKRYNDAEVAYRQAISLDSTVARIWGCLGDVLGSHLQRYDEAEEAYRQAIALEPEGAEYWCDLGVLLAYDLKRYAEAEQAYRQAIALKPEYVRAWNGLGNLLGNELQRYDEAETAYRQALALNPTFSRAWNGLGNLLSRKLQRYEEAETAYRQAITFDPKYARPWNGLGNLLSRRLKRYDEAEAAYRQAIALHPGYALSWHSLGNLLASKLKRYDEAEAAYRQAIALNPRYAQPWNGLGDLFRNNLHRYDEAEKAYRQAIALAPQAAWPLSGLGSLLADKLHRYAEAEEAYRQALAIDPKLGWVWCCLGDLLRNQEDRYEEAEAAYRQAIAIEPENGWYWFNLAMLLDITQREDEATAAYKNGIALDSRLEPIWDARQTLIRTAQCVVSAREALDAGNQSALHEALSHVLDDPDHTAFALVSEPFIEGFLVPLLANTKNASQVLVEMRSLGYEKHARPLLLAFEMAIENRAEMLSELEPEIQDATKRLLERLQAKPEEQSDS